jgi:1-acyl-sn-glycerol-3-phosphate acyltransferase
MLLTRLGIPKLWHEDPELLWHYMRYLVRPPTMWLAPSYGYGLERVPLTGGGVIAVNHLAAIDHNLVGAFCPRPTYFISKAELMETPVLGEILTWTGAFPVRRGEPDREALRHATDLVRAGKLVCVHLEGTRQRLGHPGEFKKGALLIALHTGVPVIPCGLESFGWTIRNRKPCVLVWGNPISLDDLPRGKRGLDEAARIVGDAVVNLWRQAAEARAAGFPAQLPDGTRRYEAVRPNQTAIAARRDGLRKAA